MQSANMLKATVVAVLLTQMLGSCAKTLNGAEALQPPPPHIDESLLAPCDDLDLPKAADFWVIDRDAAQAAYEVCQARQSSLAKACRAALQR